MAESVQTFKIAIIGAANVGKTSLANRFVYGTWPTNISPTIGADFLVGTVRIGSYIRGAEGVIMVYSVLSYQTFNEIKALYNRPLSYINENVPVFLVGNKNEKACENSKAVSTTEAQEYAKRNGLTFFEVSVLQNENVTEVFHSMARLVLQKRLGQYQQTQNIVLHEQNRDKEFPSRKKNGKCCDT